MDRIGLEEGRERTVVIGTGRGGAEDKGHLEMREVTTGEERGWKGEAKGHHSMMSSGGGGIGENADHPKMRGGHRDGEGGRVPEGEGVIEEYPTKMLHNLSEWNDLG